MLLRILFLTLPLLLSADPFRGELSLSAVSNGTDPGDTQLTARYLPAFESQGSMAKGWDYDVEIRWQLQLSSVLDGISLSDSNTAAEPYRVALNLQNANSEIIIGLQKINFGPARVLRSLMWFDAMNPTDPLELTPGVTGISATHHLSSGLSGQAWLLIPGDAIGWEGFDDREGTLEAGGRFSLPTSLGQLGAATHLRTADISTLFPDEPELNEWRIGLDGFWDLGVGLWTESVYKQQDHHSGSFLKQLQVTVGADYTIWMGNGLLLTTEHMFIKLWDSPLLEDQDRLMSTAMASYSPSLFDQLSLLFLYDWEMEQPLTYFSWGQTYDAFRFSLGAFYSKTENSGGTVASDFSGTGIQLTMAYNH